MRTSRVLCISTVLGSVLLAPSVYAVPVTATPFALPSDPGTGLLGTFYDGVAIDTSNSEVDKFLATAPVPAGTVRATLINYSAAGDSASVTISDWLNTSATDLAPTAAGSLMIDSTVWRFTGLIRIEASEVLFALNSDDNSRLKIGGVTIVDNDGAHSPDWRTGSAEFVNGSGLYPIEIIYFENAFGEANVELYSSVASSAVACAACFGAGGTATANFLVDTSVLYAPSAVPLPPAFALLAGALPGLFWRRKIAP
jgi:PA14 domain